MKISFLFYTLPALLLLSSHAGMKALTFTYSGLNYTVLSDNEKTVKIKSPVSREIEKLIIPTSVSYESQTYTVVEIGADAFEDCVNLKEVEMPNTITILGYQTFGYCKALTSIKLSESLTELPEECFTHCYSLESISLPESVTILGQECFDSCTKLKNVGLPSKLLRIRQAAFYNCKSLEEIYLPSSLNYIGVWAFENCVNLKTVTCMATTPPSCSTSGFIFEDSTYAKAELQVPAESLETYKITDPWFNFMNIVACNGSNEVGSISYDAKGYKVYNTNGNLILKTNTPEDLKNLPAGILIINSKKVIIK